MGLNIDPKRCAVDGCRGWRVHDSEWCAGHCPRTQAVAAEARKLARRGLKLPPLDSAGHAKEWFAVLGATLSEKRLKPSEAGELRRLAVAYLDSDPSSVLTDRLEAVEDVLQRLLEKDKEAKESWRG